MQTKTIKIISLPILAFAIFLFLTAFGAVEAINSKIPCTCPSGGTVCASAFCPTDTMCQEGYCNDGSTNLICPLNCPLYNFNECSAPCYRTEIGPCQYTAVPGIPFMCVPDISYPDPSCSMGFDCTGSGTGGGGGGGLIGTCATYGLSAGNACISEDVGGGQGSSCSSNSDCQPATGQKYCDLSTGQCSTDGNGLICSLDVECGLGTSVSRCNIGGTCSVSGDGDACSTSADCGALTPKCDESGKCVLTNSGGISCATDAECAFRCASSGLGVNNQCVQGGDGAPCYNSMYHTPDDNLCKPYGCDDANQRCVQGGTGNSCGGPNDYVTCEPDCTISGNCALYRCNTQNQRCETGLAGGIICNQNDPLACKYRCATNFTCSSGGFGAVCDPFGNPDACKFGCDPNPSSPSYMRCIQGLYTEFPCNIFQTGDACAYKCSGESCALQGWNKYYYSPYTTTPIPSDPRSCTDDTNCAYGCNASLQCVQGIGTGEWCTPIPGNPNSTVPCDYGCVGNRCVLGSGGPLCGPSNDGADCITRCGATSNPLNPLKPYPDDYFAYSCMQGVSTDSLPCTVDSQCGYSCNEYDQCVPFGGGASCDPYNSFSCGYPECDPTTTPFDPDGCGGCGNFCGPNGYWFACPSVNHLVDPRDSAGQCLCYPNQNPALGFTCGSNDFFEPHVNTPPYAQPVTCSQCAVQQPPYITGLSLAQNQCTGIVGQSAVNLQWVYNSPDDIDELKYELQIARDEDTNFDDPVFYKTVLHSALNGSTNFSPTIPIIFGADVPGCNENIGQTCYLSFGKNYRWGVRVTDENNKASVWHYYKPGACSGPSLDLLYLEGNETWVEGTTHQIAWTSENLGSSTVNVYFGSTYFGTTFIGSAPASQNFYNWAIPVPSWLVDPRHISIITTTSLGQTLSDESLGLVSISPCVPSWTCNGLSCSDPNSWGECSASGTQTRSVIDTNNCGTTTGKPAESQTCTCVPVWPSASPGCTSWSVCPAGGGTQDRTCTSTNCGTQTRQESQTCTPPPTLTVTSPNGNESWTQRTWENITWTTQNIAGGSNIDIDIIPFPSGSPQQIYFVPAYEGIYTWNVGRLVDGFSYVPVGQYKIRISVWDQGSGTMIYDESDNFFTITNPVAIVNTSSMLASISNITSGIKDAVASVSSVIKNAVFNTIIQLFKAITNFAGTDAKADTCTEYGNFTTDWAQAGVFSTPPHPGPFVFFEYSPDKPELNRQVSFSDIYSLCYDSLGNSSLCKNTSSNYIWIFYDNPSQPAYTKGSASHVFSVNNNPDVNLQICDADNICCSGNKDIEFEQENANLPNWKEISPF